MIQLTSVDVGLAEQALVLQVLRSKQIAQGPMVERLETEFAAIAGAPHVVAVSNGTTALIAALQVLGVGPGDEVITSPFTFVATLNAILAVGARARFADVGEDFNLQVQNVEALINERTVAVMPVDLFGQMADLPSLQMLAQKHGLALVEDASQAHGADVEGQSAGSFGLGCFSLYATKNITAGEGGLISTNDDDLARRLRLLRNQGMSKRYEYESIGWNYRMTDLQAALAIPQLARLSARTQRRRYNARRLQSGLCDVEALRLPTTAPNKGHVWHQFTVRVLPDAIVTRTELAEGLTRRGIASGVYYPRAVMDYDCFSDHRLVADDPVPVARQMAKEVLSLPVHPDLADEDVRTVIHAVRDICGA